MPAAISDEERAETHIQIAHDTQSADGVTKGCTEEQSAAVQVIQRNYRGYRERRQLSGLRLDASTRWTEALKEVRYRNATSPLHHPRQFVDEEGIDSEERAHRRSAAARNSWKRIGEIARHAGAEDSSDHDTENIERPEQDAQEARRIKTEAKKQREENAKILDLQYFLEMVDERHRYGPNLQTYHNEWKKRNTNENFFYWLDHGEGRDIELPGVSRARLEREQVRYLSREERQSYLVTIDSEGRLCWARSGLRITTDTSWKETPDGFVPLSEVAEEKEQRDGDQHPHQVRPLSSSESTNYDVRSELSTDTGPQHYVDHDMKRAKGVKKVKFVSATTILNQLLQMTVRPNSWIFVADTSFRLYVGLKQAGAFQHSSFLNGGRISAAGVIEIKDGQLRHLSPLSGHYRPPTANFRAFVRSLYDAGVDMSQSSISKSYLVLIGLETYVKTRNRVKSAVGKADQDGDGHMKALEKKNKKKKKHLEPEGKVEDGEKQQEEKRRERRKSIFSRPRRFSLKSSGSSSIHHLEKSGSNP